MRRDGDVNLTLARGIRSAAAKDPAKVAIAADNATRTYGELISNMSRLGDRALAAGLTAGDTVALIAPNCIEYIEIVAGLSERGLIVATLNPRLSKNEFSAIFADCEPRLAIVHESFKTKLPKTGLIWKIDQAFSKLLMAVEVGRSAPDTQVDERAPFSISYTSGTTGKPKGVLLSHRSRALLFSAMAAEYGCFGPDDHFLAIAPLYHGAGFAFACASVYFGGRCTLLEGSRADEILAAIDTYRPDGLFMVPTHFQRIFASDCELLALYRGRHSLRTIISNAAALSPNLKQASIDFFGPGLLHESYGSTEAGIVTNIRPTAMESRLRSVGKPFANMEIEVRREDGTITAPGETGELFCRGPYTFNGYLDRAEETAATLRHGWVTVGDLAVTDEEGFITITDRKKDMVVTGGVNVYPREIEIVIEQLSGVVECAVVGLTDPEWGERLHAFLVPVDGEHIDGETVAAHCRTLLADFKVPKSFSAISELPRNSSGKIMKRNLRELGEAGSFEIF